MRLWRWLLLPIACTFAYNTRRDHTANTYFAIHLREHVDPRSVAALLGANVYLEGPLGELPNHYTYSCPKSDSDRVEAQLEELKAKRKRKRDLTPGATLAAGLDGIRWHQKQELKQRLVKRVLPAMQPRQGPPSDGGLVLNEQQKLDQQILNDLAVTLDITDPIFKEQWHLFNYMNKGIDVNVTGVWLEGNFGQGVITAVIDDGLDFNSNDLKPTYYANGSWDFNDKGPDPLPRLSDDNHGTRCCGEIAAAKNDVCGVGMAYGSQISGIRILSAPISEEDEAVAVNYHYQENDIYSCSWGPPDDGKTMDAPGILIQKAMVQGVQNGRRGLGSIFVFAAGNGAAKDDNCNFDGYTNSIYSITTGAIDRLGDHPYYSEKCSAILTVTPSSGHGDAIHTTDVGTNKCYAGHGGTSAAGPLMAGAAALALSARPELTWRDLQYIAIDTAVPIHLEDGDWQDTANGRKFSHTYGFGKMDTYGMVQLAKTVELRKPQAWYHSPWLTVLHEIPEGDQGLAASFDVTKEKLQAANVQQLEHVTVTMNVNHTRRGDLSVELRSPDGRVSHIATARRHDEANSGYTDWTFMSLLHWGETGIGTWTVVVKDTVVNQHRGTFIDWRLNLWGEAIDAGIQKPIPLPGEHDDDHEIQTASVVTTSIDPGSPTSDLPEHPTDHPERPTKPQASSVETGSVTTTGTASTSANFPTNTSPATGSASASTSTASPTGTAGSEHTVSDSFLPGFFPTFGVSKKTQIWIYGSFALIVIFCLGLGAYFLIQRRKRQRYSRDDIEFEMVNDKDLDEAQGLTGPRTGRRKRGGELYNAFADDSDDDVFSDDDDDDDDEYQDTPDQSGSGSGSQGSQEHHT